LTPTIRQGGFFGKLPVAADFVAYHAGGPLGAAWQQWLLDGVSLARERLGDRWAELYEAFPSYRFLYRAVATEAAVAGSIVPSRDESGRRFPFSLFVEIADATPSFTETPAGVSPTLEAFETVADGSDGSIETLKAGADGLVPGISPAPPVNDGSVAEIAAALGNDGSVGRAVVNLVELAHRVSKWEGWTPDFGLRFPLPDGPTADAAFGLWLGLCRASLGVGEGLPSIFWTKRSGMMDVYYHPPAPLAFLFLVDHALESDHLYPVHEEEAPRVFLASGAEGEGLAKELLNRDQSVGDLIAVVERAARTGVHGMS